MLPFKRFFKGKEPEHIMFIDNLLQTILEKARFELSYTLKQREEEILIDLKGDDEPLLKSKEGRLLFALQVFLNKAIQNQFSGKGFIVNLDSDGFFEEKEQRLLTWAGKLRKKALATGRPVYLKKSLSPFDRRKVHQFLAEDGDVQTSSVGEGFYKTICISPSKATSSEGLFE